MPHFLLLLLLTAFAVPISVAQNSLSSMSTVSPVELKKSPWLADLSFRRADPLTEQDRLSVINGHLANAAGERVRLYGTNLSYDAAFPTKAQAEIIAKNISALGFNVVRFHHIDGNPSPKGVWVDQKLNEFDQDQLDKLDYFIFCLKQNGIYFVLSGHVSRTYLSLQGFDVSRLFRFGKGLGYFSEKIKDEQFEYAVKLVSHYNKYTRSTYAADPALAFFELSNEDSLVDFGFSDWGKAPPLMRQELLDKWGKYVNEQGIVESIDGAYPSWLSPLPVRIKWVDFLSKIEIEHFREYRNLLKKAGLRSLIVGSQANFAGGAGVVRENAVSDIIDVHQYWDPPRFPGKIWDRSNWIISNRTVAISDGKEYFQKIAQLRVEGKPFMMTEFDHPAPAYSSSDLLVALPAFAALQDWDGLFHFDYASHLADYDANGITNFFNMSSNYGKLAAAPIGAILFRSGILKPFSRQLSLYIHESTLRKQFANGKKRGLNTLWQSMANGDVFSPFEGRYSLVVADDPGPEDLVAKRNPDDEKRGVWVNNPAERENTIGVFDSKVFMVLGEISDLDVSTEIGDVRVGNLRYQYGAVAVISLDGRPLIESRDFIVWSVGATMNRGMLLDGTSVMDLNHNWTGSTLTENVPLSLHLNRKQFSINPGLSCINTKTSQPIAVEPFVDASVGGVLIKIEHSGPLFHCLEKKSL